MDYKNSGVDIEAGYRSVELMKQYVARTMTAGVASGLRGFGGLRRAKLGAGSLVPREGEGNRAERQKEQKERRKRKKHSSVQHRNNSSF